MSAGSRWAGMAEIGSLGALRLMAWIHRHFGRRVCTALLHPTAAYFWLRTTAARRASRQYLETLWASSEGRAALGRKPDARSTYRHFHEFSINIFDRMVAWGGGLDQMRAAPHPSSAEIFAYAGSGRGALLFCSHLGSFDMMRLMSDSYGLVVNFLMFTRHAERINSFFQSLNPEGNVRILPLDPTSARTAFSIRACIDRGEFVAIPADRVSPGGRERVAWATFLGRPARFPLGPFLLAGPLRCPVLMPLCLRIGDGVYETVLRPLGDGREVSRADREKFAGELLERYVRVLEEYCHRTPFQWFNFFDFWARE